MGGKKGTQIHIHGDAREQMVEFFVRSMTNRLSTDETDAMNVHTGAKNSWLKGENITYTTGKLDTEKALGVVKHYMDILDVAVARFDKATGGPIVDDEQSQQ